MKTTLLSAPLLLALCFIAPALRGSTPEQEQAFTAKYKAAYEAKDEALSFTPRERTRWRSSSTK